MVSSGASKAGTLPTVLCHVDFPAYCVAAITPKHLLVGGGGGAAKTGVKNGFVSRGLLRIVCTQLSLDCGHNECMHTHEVSVFFLFRD